MRHHPGGHLDRLGATQHPVWIRGRREIALVDPEPRPEAVGVATAVRGVVAVGEQDLGYRAERLVPRCQPLAPTRRVDHQTSGRTAYQV